jgi:hypothetical protein
VLRQRVIVVDKAQLPLLRVLLFDALHRLLVQRFARRTFEIAEEVDANGGRHRTDGALGR